MKPAHLQTDSQLEFNIQDCREAIAANPDNPKIYQYLTEKTACESEQVKRFRIRTARKMLQAVNDPLTYTPYGTHYGHRSRYRKILPVRNSGFDRDQFRSGCFLTGWYRLYESGRWANQTTGGK